jgi:hypothetical protein
LVAIHGNLEQLVCIDLTPQKYVRARLRCEEFNMNLIIRLRLNITIRAFINAVVKATNIPLNLIRVLHITPQYPTRGPTELRPSNQFLHTLRIEPNDEFRVFVSIFVIFWANSTFLEQECAVWRLPFVNNLVFG